MPRVGYGIIMERIPGAILMIDTHLCSITRTQCKINVLIHSFMRKESEWKINMLTVTCFISETKPPKVIP